MNHDVMRDLREADPLAAPESGFDPSTERLAAIRATVEDRSHWSGTAPTGTPRSGRGFMPLLAGAVAVAVVATVVLSLVRPGSGPSLAGVSAALDARGQIVCGAGAVVEDLAPVEAATRLLPTVLPGGWHVGRIWVTREPAPCEQTPSLTAAVLDSEGSVTSSVMIRGPLPYAVDTSGAEVTDAMIGGVRGKVLAFDDAKGPGERVWVWVVEGRTWYMKAYGFTAADNGAVAAAVRISGNKVSLDAAYSPAGLRVISQRTGPAYGTQTREQWYVTLGTGEMNSRSDGQVWMRITTVIGGPFAVDGVFPDGQTLSRENGHWVLQQHAYGGVNLYESDARPGVVVTFDPPWSGGEPTLGAMTPEQWLAAVESLAPVPVDDPRLTDLRPTQPDTRPAATHDPAVTEAVVRKISLPDPAPGFPQRTEPDDAAITILPPSPREGWAMSFRRANPQSGAVVSIIAGDLDPRLYTEAGGAEVLQRPIVAGVAGQLTRTTENGFTVTRLVFVKGKITVLVTATGAVTADELAALADSLRGLD